MPQSDSQLTGFIRWFQRLPFRTLLTVPFMVQVMGAVGLVTYFSHQSSQRAIRDLTQELQQNLTGQVHQQIESYVLIPHAINQLNASALEKGDIDMTTGRGVSYFWQQARSFPLVNHIYCANPAGDFLGAGRSAQTGNLELSQVNAATDHQFQWSTANGQGEFAQVLRQQAIPYDPRQRPWYLSAIEAQEKHWSPIYADWDSQLPTLTASIPVYGDEGTLLGVCGTDILLSRELSYLLNTLLPEGTGEIYIIERNGQLVATSSEEALLDFDAPAPQQVLGLESQSPLIRQTTAALKSKFGSLEAIQESAFFAYGHGQQRQLVQVLPFKDRWGLDWLIIVTLSKASLTQDLQENTRTSILLSLLAILGTILSGWLLVRWITLPIRKMQESAQALAAGHWPSRVEVTRSGDLGKLASAFNHMADQLQASFSDLENLNAALTLSEQRWHQFLEAIPTGILIHNRRGNLIFANQTARHLLQIGGDETVTPQTLEALPFYQATTGQPYPDDQLPIHQALGTGKIGWAEDVILQVDDHQTPLEMRSTPLLDGDDTVEYAITAFQDITARQQAQQVLADYNQTLETQVAERTEALRQSQETQKMILAAIPDLLIRYSGEGICLDIMSTGQVDLIGQVNREVGQSIFDRLPRTMAEERMEYIRLALATGDPQVYEYRFDSERGLRYEEARILVSGPHEVLVIIRDITERRQAEMALRESQTLYRSLTEVLPHSLYRTDLEGRLTFANPAFLATLGGVLEDFLGKTVYDVYPTDLAKKYDEDNRKVLETGKTLTLIEAHQRPADGEYIYVQAVKSPIYDAHGNINGTQGVFWDITALKQSEAALKAQQRFLQQVIDTMPSAIFIKDREGHFLAVNQAGAQMHGTSREAMLGHMETDFNPNISATQLAEYWAINQQVMATQQACREEQEVIDVEGNRRWYQVIISPFMNAENQVEGIIGNCIDITHRKAIEVNLKAANEQLEQLATLDGLTQIANRRRFDDYLESEWQRMVRERQPLSLILFDVDFFKPYNDYYGHQKGDECLITIAQAAQRAVKRSADLIARYGGEEFAAILPNTRRVGAEIVAQTLQQELETLHIPHPQSQVSDQITVSMGIASATPNSSQTPTDLIAAADAALYQAKRRGRNRYWIRLI